MARHTRSVRDVLWTFTFVFITAIYYGVVSEGDPSDPFAFKNVLPFLYALAVIVYVPLVAYGVLRVQLFDVDLRIKRTLTRSTVAAAFVATFFVVSELAGDYLSSQFVTFRSMNPRCRQRSRTATSASASAAC